MEIEQSVGLFYNSRAKTVCSAFCVGPNLIVTAAHCLFRPEADSERADFSDFWFSLDRPGRRAFARIRGFANGTAELHVITGTTNLHIHPPIDAADDWAVIKLSQSACERHVLPVHEADTDEIIKLAAEKKVFQVAYHNDFKEWKPAFSHACPVARTFDQATADDIKRDFVKPSGLILHQCDTGSASSGSPLLADFPGGPAVIGISVGTYVQSKVIVRDGSVEKSFAPRTIANTAVNAAEFAGKIAALGRDDVLTGQTEITEIQQRLSDLKFYSGPVGAAFGDLTRVAISEFQKSQKLSVTGLPTKPLLALLKGDSPPSDGLMLQSSGKANGLDQP